MCDSILKSTGTPHMSLDKTCLLYKYNMNLFFCIIKFFDEWKVHEVPISNNA